MMQPFSKQHAIKLLQDCIDEIDSVRDAPASGEVFLQWRNTVYSTIRHVFGNDSPHISEFNSVSYQAPFRRTASDIRYRYLMGLDQARGVLKAMVNEVEKFWSNEPSCELETREEVNVRKVFLVHGRDTAAQQSVARFLEHLELEPVILAECPNGGRTIIEKFEQESDVGYAIALFTPDDIGGLRDGNEERLRARQNVIFELGYFVGHLGRSQVCVLNVPGVDLKGAPDRTQKYSASAQRFRASDYGAAKYDYSEHTSYAAFRVSCIVK